LLLLGVVVGVQALLEEEELVVIGRPSKGSYLEEELLQNLCLYVKTTIILFLLEMEEVGGI
jgi:hypothetical protein